MSAYKDLLLCFMKNSYGMRTPLEEINIKDKQYFLQSKNIYLGNIYKLYNRVLLHNLIDNLYFFRGKSNNFINKPEITRRPDLVCNFYDRCLDFLLEGCNQIKKGMIFLIKFYLISFGTYY